MIETPRCTTEYCGKRTIMRELFCSDCKDVAYFIELFETRNNINTPIRAMTSIERAVSLAQTQESIELTRRLLRSLECIEGSLAKIITERDSF